MRWFLFILILLFSGPLLSQEEMPDSIQQLMEQKKLDTNLVNQLQKNVRPFQASQPFWSLQIAQRSLDVSRELDWKLGMAKAYKLLGRTYRILSQYSTALKDYLNAEKILLDLDAPNELTEVWNNIGVIYRILEDYEKALPYHQKALKLSREISNTYLESYVLNTLGDVYRASKEYQKALEAHQNALEVSMDTDNLFGQAPSTKNIGSTYYQMGDYEQAKKYFIKARELYESIPSDLGIAISSIDLARTQWKTKEYEQGIVNAKMAFELAKKVGAIERIIEALVILIDIHKDISDFERAFFYQNEHEHYYDSLQSVSRTLEIGRLESQFEITKKDQENKFLKKENELRQSTIFLQWLVMGSFLLLACILAYSRWSISKKNKKIQEQSQQLEETNQDLQVAWNNLNIQTKKMTDSLVYARRIQQALLPSEQDMGKVFPEHFVYFSPKDLVSGDFYWLGTPAARPKFQTISTSNGDRSVLQGFSNQKHVLAVIDCTGHGVPGGLMSMIANDLLNQIVMEQGITYPDLILSEIHYRINQLNRQNNSDIREGMDLSICTWDAENRQMEIAGAFSNTICIQNNHVSVIKGNKISIGGKHQQSDKKFTRIDLEVKEPTTFYFFTDGYQDQFGGERDRKFSPRRMREMFSEIYQYPVEEQKQIIQDRLEEWRKEQEQTDDILVVGIQV